ncbi:outer membrane protein [Sphingomonas sp. MMS24-JH45]
MTAFSVTPANYVFTRSIDWEAGIRARAGFTPNDTTLFYGTFGPGYARIDRSFSSSQHQHLHRPRQAQNQFGIQGGGGVEQKLGDNFSIGLEYLYHQYEDNDYRVRAAGPAGTPFTNAANGGTATGTDFRRSDTKFNWHSMRATAAFRF